MNYPTMNYCIAYKKQLCIMKMDILKYVTNQLFIDFFSYNSYEKKKSSFLHLTDSAFYLFPVT